MSNLLPDSLKAILPPLYSTESQGDDAIAYAKYDLMDATLYATEGELVLAYYDEVFGEHFPTDFKFFGWLDGQIGEWTYFSLNGLEYEDAVRDTEFQPQSIRKIKESLNEQSAAAESGVDGVGQF